MLWLIWAAWAIGCGYQANRIDREIDEGPADVDHPFIEAFWSTSRIILWPFHLLHEIHLRTLVKLLPPPGDVV